MTTRGAGLEVDMVGSIGIGEQNRGEGMVPWESMHDGFGRGEIGFKHVQWLSGRLLPQLHFQSGCYHPNTSFSNPESQVTTNFPAVTNTWRSEPINSLYTSGNFNVLNSGLNTKREIYLTENHLSSNTLQQVKSLLPTMTNNFYHESVSQAREYNASATHVISCQPMINNSSVETCNNEFRERELELVLRKELTKSDVGRFGRIVVPKKQAEAKFPVLIERDGMLLPMYDLILPVTWEFRYRFWPNNKSRMYVMETTGDFVREHGLQRGDLLIIYRSTTSGKYIIEGKKAPRPAASWDVSHRSFKNQQNMNEDCYTQLPISGNCSDATHQLFQEQSQRMEYSDTSSIVMGVTDSSGMGF